MSTKSREYLYGHSILFSAEKAKLALQEADKLACEAWNMRMLGYKGPAQPSPLLGDALNAGFGYLEVRCLGCDTHQTIALDIVRRPKTTPVHELERYMRCKDCSQMRSYLYKRSHLVALRSTKISASDPPSTWWPGWLNEDRQRLLKDLALLICDTRDAGFTATVEVSEYNTFIRKHPSAAEVIGGPYALSLLVVGESVVRYMAESYPGETVHLWFEKGDDGPDDEASAFLRRACKGWEQTGPVIINGFSFVPKTSALALCAADFLAWEWQRNYYEGSEQEVLGEKDGGQWRDNFKLLFKEGSKPIYPNPLWERRLELRELVNWIAGIYKD